MKLEGNEEIQFEVRANIRKIIEYVGGSLTITNKRLYFKPHPVNIQQGDVTILLENVEQAEKINVLGVAPNGMKVHLRDGTSHTFVVELPWMNRREELINYISEQVAWF